MWSSNSVNNKGINIGFPITQLQIPLKYNLNQEIKDEQI